MTHPYHSQPPRAFWARAMAGGVDPVDVCPPRHPIGPHTRIATAGSCFAQAIGQHLKQAGLDVLDAEKLPGRVPQSIAARYGYGIYSARYGNIYTARQLAELLAEAETGGAAPLIWENAGRFRDALRPTIEPTGFDSAADVALHRAVHLEKLSRMLTCADLFIFTLGLTEAWQDRQTGRTLPLCPGVAGGTFDPARHVMKNFRHGDIVADLGEILARLRRFNPAMRLLLTVSPVGLAATATKDHVLAATLAAKATLRAAAAEFVADTPDADYFPSLEIVTHPAFGGPFLGPGLRDVTPAGVARVMEIFFASHGLIALPERDIAPEQLDPADNFCDERLLEAFSR